MSQLHADLSRSFYASDPVSLDKAILREAYVVGILTAVLFVGALLVSAIMLGLKFAVVGTFVAFPMMLLIGMPLILATIGDDLAEHDHGGSV